MMTINPPTAALLLSEFVSLRAGRVGDPERSQLGGGPLPGAAGPRPRLSDRQRGAARGPRLRPYQVTGGDVVLSTARIWLGASPRQSMEPRSASALMPWLGAPPDTSPTACARARRWSATAHERRAVCGANRMFRDPARLLAREMVSASARGATPRGRRGDRRADRRGQAARTDPKPLTTSAKSRTRWRPQRATVDRARSSSSRNAELRAQARGVFSAHTPSGRRSTSAAQL
jgi:hypothetical protein